MSRPASPPPTWATDPSADIDTPPDQQQMDGWVAEDIPPAGWVNWFWNLVGDWLTFLSTAPTVYPTLEAAYADTSVEDLVLVDEVDAAEGGIGGASVASGITDGNDIRSVATSGKSVIYAQTVNLIELERRDFTTVIRTYTKTIAGSIVRCLSDGSTLWIVTSRYAEAFDMADGSSLWTYDFGATVSISDACLCRNRLVAAGFDSGAGVNVFTLNAITGALYWSFNHGEQVRAVAAAGARVFLAGTASGYASGATLRALVLDSGAAATNEGGASVDATGTAWNAVQPDEQVHKFTLSTDGKALFCGLPSTAAVQIEARGCADGELVTSRTIAGYDVQCLAVDQGFLFAAMADAGSLGRTVALCRRTLAMAWSWLDGVRDHSCVAADGTAVFVGRAALVAGQAGLYRRVRGNRPQLFRRMDPTQNPDFTPCVGALSPAME